jgi:hypothetical protein
MGWGYDRDKVQQHVDEAKTFLRYARGDERAGLEDMIGRPFKDRSELPEEDRPQPVEPVQVNIYMLHAQQLLEADLITVEQYSQIVSSVQRG